MAGVRCVGLLLIAAALLNTPLMSAHGEQQTTDSPLVLQGKCASAVEKACTLCQISLTQDLGAPAGDEAFRGSCPTMAAGRYRLEIAVPVRLDPAKPASPIFVQLQASFGATARDEAGGRALEVSPETVPTSWNWWGPTGAVIDGTTPVTIDPDVAVDVALKLEDVRYFVPGQTQGPAYRDGKLIIQKGTLVRLERVPAPGSGGDHALNLGTPREFSAKALADVVPGTTKAQVEALMGEPWRTVASDADESEPEIWEYRGKDANGIYRVHIEFDDRGMTAMIVKVPEKTGGVGDDATRAR